MISKNRISFLIMGLVSLLFLANHEMVIGKARVAAFQEGGARNFLPQDTTKWASQGNRITLEQVKDSLEQYQKHNNGLAVARTYHQLGRLHRKQNNPSSAIAHYLVAGDKYKQLDKTDQAVEVYHEVAELYRNQNHFLKALEYARQARQMASEIENDSLVAVSAFHMGRIYQEMGHRQEAEESFQIALQLFKRYEKNELLAEMYHHMAELQEQQGQIGQSLDLHQQAQAIRSEIGDSSGLVDTYYQLGQLFATRDDVSLAIDHHQQAADISQKLNNPVEAAQNYIQIGELYAKKNEHQQALDYVNQAMDIANEYNALEVKVKAMKVAATSHFGRGNIETGLKLREQLEQLQDSLEDLEQRQRRRNLVMQLRTQQKVDSLEALQVAHEKQKARLEREHFLLIIAIVVAVALVVILLLLYNRYNYRREQENILRDKNKKLEDLNARLEALNEEKNEILQTVTHDMKNPLSGIIGLADMAVTDPDSLSRDELLEFMEQIEQSAQNMNTMVTRLLDVRAIESGDKDLELEPQDAAEVLREVVQGNKQRADEKGLEIVLPEQEPGSVVWGDRTAMKRVLDNLVSNAVKYSPADKKIFLSLYNVDGHTRIEVQDQGPGIRPEERSKLFSKFGRLSSTPTSGEHSTGLGLYIAKQLTEQMDGEIGCESESGEGATFFIELKRTNLDSGTEGN